MLFLFAGWDDGREWKGDRPYLKCETSPRCAEIIALREDKREAKLSR